MVQMNTVYALQTVHGDVDVNLCIKGLSGQGIATMEAR